MSDIVVEENTITVSVHEATIECIVQLNPITVEVATLGAQGIPGPAGGGGSSTSSFDFIQASPQSSWVINHNLGYRPTVQIFSSGGVEVDASILHNSINQCTITFAVPFAGFARLV